MNRTVSNFLNTTWSEYHLRRRFPQIIILDMPVSVLIIRFLQHIFYYRLHLFCIYTYNNTHLPCIFSLKLEEKLNPNHEAGFSVTFFIGAEPINGRSLGYLYAFCTRWNTNMQFYNKHLNKYLYYTSFLLVFELLLLSLFLLLLWFSWGSLYCGQYSRALRFLATIKTGFLM